MKTQIGRPTKYRPELCQRIIEFFDVSPFEIARDGDGNPLTSPSGKPLLIPSNLPTFESFAHSIGVHVDSLYEWANVHSEFSEAKKRAQQLQKNILIQNGLVGGYNNTFAIFVGKSCLGMRDGNEVDQEAPKPLNITFTVEDARVRPEA